MKLISITAISTTAEIENIEMQNNSSKEKIDDDLPSTPAKMLDGRHLDVDISREFIHLEQAVTCAENDFELSKVLRQFCTFCDDNPLYLRTRNFVPWRQVVADLTREEIVLNGKSLKEHCVSTGQGIVRSVLQCAARDEYHCNHSDDGTRIFFSVTWLTHSLSIQYYRYSWNMPYVTFWNRTYLKSRTLKSVQVLRLSTRNVRLGGLRMR